MTPLVPASTAYPPTTDRPTDRRNLKNSRRPRKIKDCNQPCDSTQRQTHGERFCLFAHFFLPLNWMGALRRRRCVVGPVGPHDRFICLPLCVFGRTIHDFETDWFSVFDTCCRHHWSLSHGWNRPFTFFLFDKLVTVVLYVRYFLVL